MAFFLSRASAQNLSPPSGYQPIPNFTGIGAGLQFRETINDRFSGAQWMAPELVAPSFANLPAEQDAELLYCKDCRRSTPCVSGGSGAWALGRRGQWSCSTGALEASLKADGNKITSSADGTVKGDALAFGQTPGEDLGGSLPNPTLATVLGGQAPVTKSTAMIGGDLTGTLPAATVQIVLGGKAPIYLGQTGAQINKLAGAISVMRYGAQCDGVTDDTAALQNAILAGCGGGTLSSLGTGPHGEVYFPSTGHSCVHSLPLHIPCSYFAMDGPRQGHLAGLSHSYWGPAVLAEIYGQSNLEYGPALVGSGNSLNMKSFVVDSKGFISLNYALNSAVSMNGLSAFNIHFVFRLTSLAGSGGFIQPVFASSTTTESIANGAGGVPLGAAFHTHITNGTTFDANLHFTSGTVGFPSFSPSINTNYEVELNSDGAGHCQEFINGTQNGATQICTGTLVMDPYEAVTLPSMDVSNWPANGNLNYPAWGFIDAVKIESASVHTSNYTPVTSSKPTADANTLVLVNFDSPTTQTQDTQPIYVGNSSSFNGYFPVLTGGNLQASFQHLSYLELCGSPGAGQSGLYAQSVVSGSEFDHLWCSKNTYIGLDFYQNDFLDSVHDNQLFGGSLCINFGAGFSEAHFVGSNSCSQQGTASLHTCYVSNSASFTEIGDYCQDVDNPGDIIFPWVDLSSHNTHIFPFLDAEFGNSTVMKGSFGLIQGSYSPETIINPEGNTRNNAPFILQSGGYPVYVEGLDWANEPASTVINITSNPLGPDIIENSVLPSNGNAACTGSGTPNACCAGARTGTCPTPALSNVPAYVDSRENVYDSGAVVADYFNGGISQAPNIIGTVTTSTTISFAKQSVQDLTTATTGLTYTLSTAGVAVNQDVIIRSHIAGSITGPLWATSSGAIKWAGGSAPTSSGTSGYTDILRLYFDGTNWQEISRSIGNH